VVLVADPETPQLPEILREVCQVLLTAGVEAEGICIIQGAGADAKAAVDPRSELPPEIQSIVQWRIHDPSEEHSSGYLATTLAGERIYLAKEIIAADNVLLIGPVEFDDLLGIRGPTGSLFPGLSDEATRQRFQGQGHDELGLEDVRPATQMVEEVAYLLGNQFSIGVIAGPGNSASQVLAGQTEAVSRSGRELLQEEWKIDLEQRVELVLLAVDADSAGHGWNQICRAIDVGRRLVERDGRIVVISQLNELPGEALRLVGSSHAPREALQALNRVRSPDRRAAIQLARALDWANVYLLSDLPVPLLEELYLLPLANTQEVSRLLEGDDLTVIISGAQHAYGRCQG
jgi:nickel-dependent lactate racemase